MERTLKHIHSNLGSFFFKCRIYDGLYDILFLFYNVPNKLFFVWNNGYFFCKKEVILKRLANSIDYKPREK